MTNRMTDHMRNCSYAQLLLLATMRNARWPYDGSGLFCIEYQSASRSNCHIRPRPFPTPLAPRHPVALRGDPLANSTSMCRHKSQAHVLSCATEHMRL